MHTLALQLAPILAAEKSKVPFYIAGGLLVTWALVVSLGLGLRRPDFPGDQAGQRRVIAVSVALVLAALSTAVITSGSTSPAGAAGGSAPAVPAAGESAAAPAPQSSSSSAPAQAPPAPATGVASTLPLAANSGGQLSYDAKALSAKAGRVTITLTNSAPIEHNVAVAEGATVLGTTPTFSGGSKSLTLSLKPGTYTFYCTVPGHRQAGMEGTLKVS
jgi:uncharacterized cupredoxin-like copper-binding protein